MVSQEMPKYAVLKKESASKRANMKEKGKKNNLNLTQGYQWLQ